MPIYLGGTLIPTGADNLDALDDVIITGTPGSGSFLRHNGTAYVNVTGLVSGDIPAATASLKGGVSVAANQGLTLTSGGALSVAAATSSVIGGVIPDADQFDVSASGVLTLGEVPVNTLQGTIVDENLPGKLSGLPTLPADPNEDRDYLLEWDDSAGEFTWIQYVPASFDLEVAGTDAANIGGVYVASTSNITLGSDGALDITALPASAITGTLTADQLPSDIFETHIFVPVSGDSNFANLLTATNNTYNPGELWILTDPASGDSNGYIFTATSAVTNAATNASDWTPLATSGASNLTLGPVTATTQVIENSNGSGFTLPSATSSTAGLLNTTDKAILDSLVAAPAATNGGNTNYVLKVQDTDNGGGITRVASWVEETDTNTFRNITIAGTAIGSTVDFDITAGNNITLTGGSNGDLQISATDTDTHRTLNIGSATITGTGAATFNGTTNEIEVTASGNTVTWGLPSSITANVTGDLTGTADDADEINVITTTSDTNGNHVDGITTAMKVRRMTQAEYDEISSGGGTYETGTIYLVTE